MFRKNKITQVKQAVSVESEAEKINQYLINQYKKKNRFAPWCAGSNHIDAKVYRYLYEVAQTDDGIEALEIASQMAGQHIEEIRHFMLSNIHEVLMDKQYSQFLQECIDSTDCAAKSP